MTNRLNKTLLLGASPLLLLVASMVSANAQSTATEAIETVTSTSVNQGFGGIMKPIEVAKERSTITQDYLVTQAPGQTIADSLNKVPGFNFTNNDPYGSSGGNIRIHGFDGNHISLTWDGMPLNDTGNYAIFTNQLPDSEDLGSVTVNQGGTDVDSPSAAASGGVVAMRTSRPSDKFSLMFQPSVGSFNFQRYFARVDSGAFGPFDTLAFASFSLTSNDKFKGQGQLQKRQYNLAFYQDLGSLGFITLAAHYNMNRNNNYYNSITFYPEPSTFVPPALAPALPNITLDPNTGRYVASTLSPAGSSFTTDYQASCQRVAPVAGTTQADTLCNNFYGRQINPSDTGNIRISSLFHLTPDISLTFDPSVQYVLADGGSQYGQIRENDPRLIGASTALGKDLNGDGDVLDTVGLFNPSVTNTLRYGINTSLLWHIADDHTLQLAYTLDRGQHRQTGQMVYLNADGTTPDPFGGWRDIKDRVLGADGSQLVGRDRKSRAILSQAAVDYEGDFFNETFHTSIGARLPILTRELDQHCFLQVVAGTATSPSFTPGVGFPECGNVRVSTFNATNNTATLQGFGNSLFVLPAKETVEYSRFLPNVGFTYSPFGKSLMLYADWATSISVPRTDNLYNGGNNGKCASTTGVTVVTALQAGCVFSSFNNGLLPETSNNYDIGVRYNDEIVSASITAWNNQFKNRIVTSYDPDQGISIDRNIGAVNSDGIDGEVNLFPFEGFSSYSSVSYTHSRVADTPGAKICIPNCAVGNPVISLVGKEVVETPNWTLSQRVQYKIWGFNLGFGAKYTGRRYATDTNDLRIPSYVTVDSDITYDLGQIGWKNSFIKLNVQNLMDEKYFASIASQRCFRPDLPTTGAAASGCGAYPGLSAGFPQTFQLTLRTAF